MKRLVRTVPLLLLLPFFLILQIFLVPHLHIDEHGDAHAHSHVVTDDGIELNFHDDISSESAQFENLASRGSHEHSHDELHSNTADILFHKLASQIKLLPLQSLSETLSLPSWISKTSFPYNSTATTAYLDHIFRYGHFHALQDHILRILSVRLTT